MRDILFYRGKGLYTAKWYIGVVQKLEKPSDAALLLEKKASKEKAFKVVELSTIGQYTGKTDADGKEIWEGDIVMFPHFAQYVVEWDADTAAFILRSVRDPKATKTFYGNIATMVQVVGNIHDNAEMLVNG